MNHLSTFYVCTIAFAALPLQACGTTPIRHPHADQTQVAAPNSNAQETTHIQSAQQKPWIESDINLKNALLPSQNQQIDSCYKADTYSCESEKEILRLVNELRASKNVPTNTKTTFALGKALSFAARDWSQKQANNKGISHDGFPMERYHTISQEFRNTDTTIMAENVAMTSAPKGASALEIARHIFALWIDSPVHYANMMSDCSTIGIGVINLGSNWYGTQIFGEEVPESQPKTAE